MNSILKLLIVFYVLLGFTSCDNHEQISFKNYLITHKYAVGQSNYTIIDSLRNRPLKTEIWYPTKDTLGINITSEYPFILPPTSKDAEFLPEKFPLILLSHGTGGNRISQLWLASELASSGFVVLAVDHYGNTLDNKIPENFVKVWDRPLDISFSLTNILNNTKFSSIIDNTKIGMTGFSLGGYTTIALAGGILDYNQLKEFSKTEEGEIEFNLPEFGNISHFITPEIIESGNKKFKDLKDDRISAFVAMAPAIGQGFKNSNQFDNVDNPILILGAENDKRTPVKTNAKHYNSLIKNSNYIELEGQVGHYVFMNKAKNGLKRNAPIIFKDEESVDRSKIHREVSNDIIEYFKTYLGKNNK